MSTPEAASVQFLVGDNANCSIPGTGMEITEPLAIPATGGTAQWDFVSVYGVWAPAGSHSLKLCVKGGVGTHVDRITFVLVSADSESVLSLLEGVPGSCPRTPHKRSIVKNVHVSNGEVSLTYSTYGATGVELCRYDTRRLISFFLYSTMYCMLELSRSAATLDVGECCERTVRTRCPYIRHIGTLTLCTLLAGGVYCTVPYCTLFGHFPFPMLTPLM